ncbi:MAG: PilZ domain-containing protein [Desulfovibrio sp.]
MADGPVFSSVSVRLRAYARRADDPSAPALFRWINSPTETSSEAELVEAQVSPPLARFLLALDRKLDQLAAMHSGASVREEYPLRLEVLEISGSGLAFRTEEHFDEGEILEVVLVLSDAPPRMVAATGRVAGSGPDRLHRLDFTTIRENDLETVVRFVFQEEREQIRRGKGTRTARL